MGIHEDAEQGLLVGDGLEKYTKDNPSILEERNPKNGLTPLAAATVGGYNEEIEELLNKGAKADTLCRDGETPLLLAAWKTKDNRPRIIQLILGKTPASFIDVTTPIAENNTPLMFVVKKKDIESIRLLRKANASLTLKNNEGINAKDMAEATEDKAVLRALNPAQEESALAYITSAVVGALLYVVAWVNENAKEVVRRVYGLNPYLEKETDDVSTRFLISIKEIV